MDQTDNNSSMTLDFEQDLYLEMIKTHLTNGLLSLTENVDSFLRQYYPESIALSNDVPTTLSSKKRMRIKFSQEQLDALEATFEQHRYPTMDIIDDLVQQLNLPTQNISIWFQNRRSRWRRSQQKLEEHPSFDEDEQRQYDNEIDLDEELPRPSLASAFCNRSPSPPFLNDLHSTFDDPIWQDFPCSFYPTIPYGSSLPDDFVNPNSPFAFQDMTNYQYSTEFYD